MEEEKKKTCLFCNTPINRNKKYCSKSCGEWYRLAKKSAPLVTTFMREALQNHIDLSLMPALLRFLSGGTLESLWPDKLPDETK
jgi:predicted nucleic acid-binding Zn ribbon protein